MAGSEESWGQAAAWYPDIVAIGDACGAWQAEFDRQAMSVRVRPREIGGPRTATVENGKLHADLTLSPWKRGFYLALRRSRRTMLQGFASDLAVASGAVWGWLSGARPGAVASAWPFLGSVALAEARERGDRVESAWFWLYENHCDDPVATRLRAFVSLALQKRRLRSLLPYTSHWALSFSATAEWPFSGNYPIVVPAETPDRYVVRTRDGHAHEETDAGGALRLVLADIR
jgi:hypothetical protein